MKGRFVLAFVGLAALSGAQTKLPDGYVEKLIEDLAREIPEMGLAWEYDFPNPVVPNTVRMFAWFGEPAIPRMVALLDSEEYWQVVIGALTLAKLGDKSQIHKLTLMAQDHPKGGVRQIAVRALGELKAIEAVEPLIEIVRAGNEDYVVSAAVTALGEIGDRRAIPVLVEKLGRQVQSQLGTESTSWLEIDALGKFGEHAIPALEPLLQSADRAKALAALRALGEIKSEQTKRILVKALDEPATFETAVNIFMTTEQQYDGDVLVRVFERLDVRDQAWLVEVLHRHGDKRSPDMARRVWATIYAQLVAGKASGYDLLLVIDDIKPAGFVPPASEMIDAVVRSDDLRVVSDAFDLLKPEEINAGAAHIVAKLTDWDSDDFFGDDMDDLAETLAKAGPNGGAAAIALVLGGKGTDEFKRVALAKMMRAEHADGLRQIMQGKDEKSALYAAIGLANLGLNDSAPVLRRFAESKDEMSAARALSALVQLGDPWGRGLYLDRFSRYYFEYSASEDKPYSQFLVVREYKVGLRHLDHGGKERLASELKRLYKGGDDAFYKAVYWLLGANGSWAEEMLAHGGAEVKALVLGEIKAASEADVAARYRALLFDKDASLRYRAYRYLKGKGEFDPPPTRRPESCRAAW